MAPPSTNQTKSCSNISGKVRVVARIRSFIDHELLFDAARATSVISVRKSDKGMPSEKVTLSFEDQTSSRKNAYEVDSCYQQNEDTSIIFSKEIKPHISRVFDGKNATFFAFGARGSGKTYSIQGSKENLGLGMLAMDEILKITEGRHAVAVSIYEVFQDRVYDLLDSKNPEVQVLEDAQGKITLKGLSKVPVKSMLEFQKLFYNGSSFMKPTLEPRRSHKALMIHILACDEGSGTKLVGKMNFVDLAGYENARKNSIEGTRINKSLNAFLNVIHAINANESRVPYRESKLARVLQDSLGGSNHVFMLVCLNPLFCLDTIHAITLASRLTHVKPVAVCSATTKQTNSHLPSSVNKANSGVAAVCSMVKKQTNSRLPLSAKKTNVVLKERNPLGDAEQSNGSKQKAKNPSHIVKSNIPICDSTVAPNVNEEKCSSDTALFKSDVVDHAPTIVPCSNEEEIPVSVVTHETEWLVTKEEDVSTTQNICIEVTPAVNKKENNSLVTNEGQSPPLSVKLKQLSDNLRSLCSPTPLSINRPWDNNKAFVDTEDPKTPMVTREADDTTDLSNFKSASGKFSQRSSRMKDSLVQDYLQFLNSANKEDLKGIKGIGEKRASYILELRETSPQPFKTLDDIQDIGLSAKQVRSMMKNVVGELF